MRTKNPGEEMDVFPLLYVGGLGKEFYIDNDTRYKITNEWTYVGVTYDNLDGYFRSNGEEMPDLDDKATYVACLVLWPERVPGKCGGRCDVPRLLHRRFEVLESL